MVMFVLGILFVTKGVWGLLVDGSYSLLNIAATILGLGLLTGTFIFRGRGHQSS